MSATKFTDTAATIIGTTKIAVETAAGVKGYATPLTLSLSEAKGADIASVAGVTDIGAATGAYIHITGTEAITGLGTCTAGQRRTVKFTGACTLTHNGTSLILPGAANITTAANDTAEFCSLGSGNWICLWYKKTSGLLLGTANASQIIGTTTNDSASAGRIGEYISSSVASGSAVSLTNATAADVTSVSLTAGDWDVDGLVAFTLNAATTMTIIAGWVSTTSATQPTLPNAGGMFLSQNSFTTGVGQAHPTGSIRMSLASTTTVYLGARANFAVNTCAAYGFIGARRVR
jgi:hypothetical protein